MQQATVFTVIFDIKEEAEKEAEALIQQQLLYEVNYKYSHVHGFEVS